MGKRTLNRKTLDLEALFLAPIFGGEDDDDDDNDDAGKGGNPKPSGKNKSGGGNDDDDDDDDDHDDLESITDPKDRRIVELSREAAKKRREKNAEKRRADELQRKLDEKTNSGASAEEQLKAKLQAEKDRNDKLTGTVSNNILKTAIVENEKFKWHDTSVVMGLLDREAMEIDIDDMSVDGLEEQLKKLAKEKPFLLKKKAAGEGGGSSGFNPRGGNASDEKVASEKTLREKYGSVLG